MPESAAAIGPPDAEREAIYARGLEPFTEQTLVTGEELEQEVARVRERGYAYSQGQRSKGAIGLGAPLFDAAGDVFGDVCITIRRAGSTRPWSRSSAPSWPRPRPTSRPTCATPASSATPERAR
jgi:DNA-binding IclR family transcriptional regulator